MIRLWLNRWRDLTILFLAMFLAILRGSVVGINYPDITTKFGAGQLEILIWLLALGLAALTLWKEHLLSKFWFAWKKNWVVLLFIGLAFFSIIWSVSATTSLYRALVLLFSTILAAYIGVRYSMPEIMEILFWFGAILIILCFAVAVFFPETGRMMFPPYDGAWRGFFKNKNLMGIILTFLNAVYFLRLILKIRKRSSTALVEAGLFLLSLALVVLSRSATGYILILLLGGLVLVSLVWLQLRPKLRPVHYYALAGLVIIGIILAITNLNFVFGLFNRDASLTGRLPMWSYLLKEFFTKRPWLGYGFGAIWTLEQFRTQVQQAVGWTYPVGIADNGFLDILLHLGLVGLAVFLLNFISMVAASIRYAFRKLIFPAFFPLLVMVHALVANISFSLFLELEAFVWLIMVAVWFAITTDLQFSADS